MEAFLLVASNLQVVFLLNCRLLWVPVACMLLRILFFFQLFTMWITTIGRLDLADLPKNKLAGRRICDMHFSKAQLAENRAVKRHRSKLKLTAVPDLHINCKCIFVNYPNLSGFN